jgi:E3 ubiquitin-protein ligase UBR4
MSTASKVGTLVEILLDALKTGNQEVEDQIEALRDATYQEKKKAALAKREQMLADIGLKRQEGGKLVALVKPSEMLEELADERGFSCMVCHEGYSYKPTEMLGFYVYAKKCNIHGEKMASGPLAARNDKGEKGYTTVSHFNIIHFSCHRDATRAERSMKQPKEEWDGATLRNNQTKCNNLFPIQGPQTSDEAYGMCLERFWSNLSMLARHETHSRFELLVHNLKFLLLRFAREESFSTDSKGGGRESNIRTIPFFMQMGLFLLDYKSSKRSPMDSAMTQFLDACKATDVFSRSQDDVAYKLALSLFILPHDKWKENKTLFIQAALLCNKKAVQTGQQAERITVAAACASPMAPNTPTAPQSPMRSPFPSGQASSSAPGSAAKDGADEERACTPPPATPEDIAFSHCRPMLLLVSLVDQLHEVLKSKIDAAGASWAEAFRRALCTDGPELAEACFGLLEMFEEDLLKAEGFDELFDIAGWLGSIVQPTGQHASVSSFVSTNVGPL